MAFEIRSILIPPFFPMDFKEISGQVYWRLEVAGRTEEELWTPVFWHVCEGVYKTEKKVCFYMTSGVKKKLSWVHLVHFSSIPFGLLEILHSSPAASHFSTFSLWMQISHSRCLGLNLLNSCPCVLNTGIHGHPLPLRSNPH